MLISIPKIIPIIPMNICAICKEKKKKRTKPSLSTHTPQTRATEQEGNRMHAKAYVKFYTLPSKKTLNVKKTMQYFKTEYLFINAIQLWLLQPSRVQ